jgi:hypothetical protein
VQFERYVDDAVVHCVSERQARTLRQAIGDRMEQVGLRLHPDKTKIVYCRDDNRRGRYTATSFTFLGFTFRPREARDSNGRTFTAFLPAISNEALKRISREVRRCGCIYGSGRASPTSPERSTRSCAAGCSTTGRFTAPRCTPSCSASTPTCCAGSARNTDDFGDTAKPRQPGNASPASTHGCSPTGHGSPRSDDQDDTSRMNREVHVRNLWEPAGANPAGHPAY